jgi:hypothetical protein
MWYEDILMTEKPAKGLLPGVESYRDWLSSEKDSRGEKAVREGNRNLNRITICLPRQQVEGKEGGRCILTGRAETSQIGNNDIHS